MAYTTVTTGNVIEAEHVKELQGSLDGTSGRGQVMAFTDVSDSSNYALDIRNQDSTNSYGLRVKDNASAVIITAAKAAFTIGKKIVATGLGTYTAAANMFDLAATWNLTADTFNAIKVNITNTASAAASTLVDLQKAGTSLFKVAISGAVTSALGTVTTAIDQLTLTATWNESATLFRAIMVNVTNTASATTSRLLDLQVGGTSKFSVNRDGLIIAGGHCIAETVVTVAAATIDFTSIPATYRHLQLALYARGDTAATTATVGVTFNNDSAANYDLQTVTGTASTAAAAESFDQSNINLGSMAAASASANLFTPYEVIIPHYANSANNKTLISRMARKIGTATGNLTTIHLGGFWRSNAAINRITLTPGAGNFDVGTVATLYGLPTA